MLPGTTTEQELRRALTGTQINAEIVLVKTNQEGIDLVEKGEVAAYFADRATLTFLLRKEKQAASLLMADTYLSVEPIALGDAPRRQRFPPRRRHGAEPHLSAGRDRADLQGGLRPAHHAQPAAGGAVSDRGLAGLAARSPSVCIMRLSVLDQSIAVAGRPHDQSIRNTVALAQHCEALGYERFWVSEHHNHPTIVGTAPEIVIAAIAATTERIRIGSAGIMLPHYAPFKVAEVFRVLDALAPGRIDLGLGRAPGSDGRTAFALNPAANERPEHFPADVRDLIAWVHNEPLVDRHPFAAVKAFPQGATAPEVWILGSSDYGAQVAALFGLPYCYAWFFSDGAGGERAIELYKQHLSAERAPSRAALGPLRLGAGRRDDGRGAVPLHLARALAHAIATAASSCRWRRPMSPPRRWRPTTRRASSASARTPSSAPAPRSRPASRS